MCVCMHASMRACVHECKPVCVCVCVPSEILGGFLFCLFLFWVEVVFLKGLR